MPPQGIPRSAIDACDRSCFLYNKMSFTIWRATQNYFSLSGIPHKVTSVCKLIFICGPSISLGENI